MIRIITLNVNGIRSAAKKGFFGWLSKQNVDLTPTILAAHIYKEVFFSDHAPLIIDYDLPNLG